MPLQSVWLNLPVKNLEASKKFFQEIGFEIMDGKGKFDESTMAGVLIGKNKFHVMLCSEALFESFTQFSTANTSKGSEMLISMDAESREEVDAIASRIEPAGGKLFGGPGEKDGWIYGFGFLDLDGHRWNIIYMDFAKLPK